MPKYSASSALREYVLEGNPITSLEAMLLFGVQNPTMEFTRIRRDGFMLDSRLVPMAKAIRRINEYTVCKVPSNLPYKEIQLTEYWLKK